MKKQPEVLPRPLNSKRANGGVMRMGVRKMPKAHFNIQDQFLNQVRKARIEVEALLVSGEKIIGFIRSFDTFCVIIENNEDIILIYKHALSIVRPSERGIKIPGLI